MSIKRLAALILSVTLCAALLAGCAGEEDAANLSVCVGAAPQSLDPIYAQESGDQTILAHLYENLMRVTTDVSGQRTIAGGMAKKVEQEENRDGTITYTFRLRNARWSDGRSVRAGDFVYAWQRLADPATASPYASLLSMVAGYEEARAAGNMELLEVTAKNDSTLVVVLSSRCDWFLEEVCTSTATVPLRQDVVQRLKTAAAEASQEGGRTALRWWWNPTTLVTNGPYQAVEYQEGKALTANTSERYYDNISGPSSLVFHFADTPEEAWALYEAEAVDVVWPLPDSRLTELANNEGWTPLPELSTYAVLLNCGQDLLANPLVRKAFCLAIDRGALAGPAGVSARIAEGVVPPGVPETGTEKDFRTAGGPLLELEDYDAAEAQAALAEAGYDSGESLGELTYIYVDEGFNGKIAEAVCRMWQEVLQVQVTPRALTEKAFALALQNGDYLLAGREVTAPGNDAECFLSQWVTGDKRNLIQYANSAYDTLLAVAAGADGTARLGCLHDAEELMLLDYALAPLYTRVTDWTLREDLTGIWQDPRGWFGFAGAAVKSA